MKGGDAMSLIKDFIESQTENVDKAFLEQPYTKELILQRNIAIANFTELLQDNNLESKFHECLEVISNYNGYGFFWAYEKGCMDIIRLIKELTK